MAVLDPTLERLSGRHLLGCVVWTTEQVVDAHLCHCPSDPDADAREAMYADLAADLPLNVFEVQQRLAELARLAPDQARDAVDGLQRHALRRIASGASAVRLARAALLAVGDDWRWRT